MATKPPLKSPPRPPAKKQAPHRIVESTNRSGRTIDGAFDQKPQNIEMAQPRRGGNGGGSGNNGK